MYPEPEDPFEVILPRIESEKLKKWADWSLEEGVSEQFYNALEQIERSLATEPNEWGEPKFSLKHLKLSIRLGGFSILYVWFGVHLHRPVVYIKKFLFSSLPGLGRPDEK